MLSVCFYARKVPSLVFDPPNTNSVGGAVANIGNYQLRKSQRELNQFITPSIGKPPEGKVKHTCTILLQSTNCIVKSLHWATLYLYRPIAALVKVGFTIQHCNENTASVHLTLLTHLDFKMPLLSSSQWNRRLGYIWRFLYS